MTYTSSIEALRQLTLSKDNDIVKISPKGYALSNGLDYCCVGLKSNEGSNYLVQAYGKEARELFEEATMIVSNVENRMVSIVDDDPDITLLFDEVLKSISRITIFTFTDPILALEHFQVNEYAYVLVISDYKMPGLNGMEFLKKIKDANRFVRTILMTAFQIEDKVFNENTKKKIINAFLQKPIGIHDLVKEVDTQLDAYEMQKKFPSD